MLNVATSKIFNISTELSGSFLSVPDTLDLSQSIGLRTSGPPSQAESLLFPGIVGDAAFHNMSTALNIWDSGCNRACFCSLKYAIPGTVRDDHSGTVMSTANGLTKPEKVFNASVRVKVSGKRNEYKIIEFRDSILISTCPHNLLPAGSLAERQGIGTWIAPSGGVSYIKFEDGAISP